MAKNQESMSGVNRFQKIALGIGLVGLAAGVAGIFISSLDRFFQAYLIAFMFWLGLSLGSLAFLFFHFLSSGRWGLTVRRVNEAAASTLWLMALLFIPLLFNLRGLYSWMRPEIVQASAILQSKSLYLNEPFFIVRALIYFAIWILFAFLINRFSARWAKDGNPQTKSRLQGLAAGGLILYILTMTFAAIDWLLSLQPTWNSTVYGLLIIFNQLLSSLSFALIALSLIPASGVGRDWTAKNTPVPYKDLGAFMLTFVMAWAYLAYFQLLIIWAGNLPHEVTWYFDRSRGGWLEVGVVMAVLQFILPFALLLSGRVRNNLRALAWLSALILIGAWVNMFWQVIPAFYPGQFNFYWLDLVLPVGVGGLWVSAFLFALKRRPALRQAEQDSLVVQPGAASVPQK